MTRPPDSPPQNTVKLEVEIPAELAEKMQAVSQETGYSLSFITTEALVMWSGVYKQWTPDQSNKEKL